MTAEKYVFYVSVPTIKKKEEKKKKGKLSNLHFFQAIHSHTYTTQKSSFLP